MVPGFVVGHLGAGSCAVRDESRPRGCHAPSERCPRASVRLGLSVTVPELPTRNYALEDCSQPHLICPRCRLSLTPKTKWLAIKHCPRCIARTRTAVRLFPSALTASELYAEHLDTGLRPAT